jgi:hypothetical protein
MFILPGISCVYHSSIDWIFYRVRDRKQKHIHVGRTNTKATRCWYSYIEARFNNGCEATDTIEVACFNNRCDGYIEAHVSTTDVTATCCQYSDNQERVSKDSMHRKTVPFVIH